MSQTKARLRSQIEVVLIKHGIQDTSILEEIMAVARPNKPSETVIPQAVERYHRAMLMWPPKDLWDSMAEGIGTEPSTLDRWELHCQQWRLRGYRINNFVGLYDSFKAGGLQQHQAQPTAQIGYDIRGQLARQMLKQANNG